MVTCPGCGDEVSPQLDLAQAKPGANGGAGGGYYMAQKCPKCRASLGRADGQPAPAAPAPAPQAPDMTGVVTLGGLIGHDRAAAIQGAPAPAGPPPAPPVASALPPAADDIVATAARRLAFVEGEIAKLRGYEDERELLERIISAAAPPSAERKAS